MDIRLQADTDAQAVDGLMKAAFGAVRSQRAVWHLRPGPPVQSLCLVASKNNKICGSLRFWEVLVCGRPQLLLGPLAVQPELHGQGYGRALVIDGLRRAQQQSQWDFVLVSGDPDYYPKFSFSAVAAGQFIWPGDIAPNVLHIRALHKTGLDSLPDGPSAVLPITGRITGD
ncbi:putative acetyltransferase [SAR116 cluster alpha proteobacterium HIMB100]|nr:putative acetyltransferase [SAR116 cluster alpha proteobacterium HIMB100]